MGEKFSRLLDVLTSIIQLLVKLRMFDNAPKLLELTHIRAVLPNVMRCIGKFRMVKNFMLIEKFVCGKRELYARILSPAQHCVLDQILKHFEKIVAFLSIFRIQDYYLEK